MTPFIARRRGDKPPIHCRDGGPRRPTLAEWQKGPQNRWSYQHVRELVPTALIRRGPMCRDLPPGSAPSSVVAIVDALVAETEIDGLLLLHEGRVIVERYCNGMEPESKHLLQSASKSICGTLVGVLEGQGILNPGVPVTRYLNELSGSAWEGCTIRHALDMTAGTDFSEEYDDPGSDIVQSEAVIGWSNQESCEIVPGLWEYIAGLGVDTEHGSSFRYRSILTDLLAWLIERVTHRSYADVLSRELWVRMGAEFDAEITVNAYGDPGADGGISCTLRDFGRFGELVRLFGDGVVPANWIEDTIRGDEECRRAWTSSGGAPTEHYRNQWWVDDPTRGILCAIGTYGQMLYVNVQSAVVVASLASWPSAVDKSRRRRTFEAVEACCDELGRPELSEGEK
jgi:CubicO group peptidase (beta-lactamase class C family)